MPKIKVDEKPFGKEVSDLLKKHHALFRKGRALDVGCGNGASTRWLKDLGFEAIGIDLKLEDHLATDFLVKADIREFKLQNFNLIIAINILSFLSFSERQKVLKKFTEALNPGGHVVIESFTTKDDRYLGLKKQGVKEAESNTFWSQKMCSFESYFSPNELLKWAESAKLKKIYYEEKVIQDEHFPEGLHTHGVVSSVFQSAE